ncbi:MAG: Maf family protein [Chitinispirillaceae bacterium]|jgi:septum formation protein|nr:Maf family protein [Chitinispirillaceae bacterium]
MHIWNQPGRPVVLASRSPRRSQILSLMGFTFTTIVPDEIDEASYIDAQDLSGSLCRLAAEKTRSVSLGNPAALVLGADTIVVKGERVMGKPGSRYAAEEMLSELSDSRHTVMTGLALRCGERSFVTTAAASTDVFFRKVSAGEIGAYLDTGEYRDKAGAYAIQGRAMIFVESISGCYYNVVGLPVSHTIGVFTEFLNTSGAVNE